MICVWPRDASPQAAHSHAGPAAGAPSGRAAPHARQPAGAGGGVGAGRGGGGGGTGGAGARGVGSGGGPAPRETAAVISVGGPWVARAVLKAGCGPEASAGAAATATRNTVL